MQHHEGELGSGNKQATIADWTILSSHEPQTSKQQCLLLLLQWPTWASPILCAARTRGHLYQQIALDGFMWMLRICWGVGGREMRSIVWRPLTSHPEVVSSFLATWDAWLKTCDVPNYISQPFRAQTWAPGGAPGRSGLQDSCARWVPIPRLLG